ncbi:MAG TPA: alanine racemase [Gemmatimonadaceae bacterium]|nr:alanine racemase [Gemmatimonadaceae bacterium]
MSASVQDLETPALLVDLDRLERNLDRMAAYTAGHGLALRPHVKTHKSPWLAGQQLRRGAAGLTCATPREAEVMSAAGDNLLLAYPPIGTRKLERLMALPAPVRLTVALDSAAAVEPLAAAAALHDREVGVYIEVDVGMHRVGVCSTAEAIALARLVRARPPLAYAGIAFYPGHIRARGSEQAPLIEQLGAALAQLLAELDRTGLAPPVVSGGSTPTAWHAHEIDGLTEVRPGTYVFNDRATAELGACAWDDCALTVLATVVSTAVPGQAVVDAGTKALGREPLPGAPGQGFGVLLDRPEVTVARMSEEHGILDLHATVWKPEVGERVRIIPNHVCIAVHLADAVHGVRESAVETEWPVAARGR